MLTFLVPLVRIIVRSEVWLFVSCTIEAVINFFRRVHGFHLLVDCDCKKIQDVSIAQNIWYRIIKPRVQNIIDVLAETHSILG